MTKEPVTIICSQLGWIRALKGHGLELERMHYKDGDSPRFALELFTTDKILIFTGQGKFYTIPAHTINITKGDGDQVNALLDLERDEYILDMQQYKPERQLLLVSKLGKGFIVSSNEALAQTRVGKKIMNLGAGDEAMTCALIQPQQDLLALLSDNRKLLIIKVADIARMKKGQGTQLQKCQGARLAAIKLFASESGLSWTYLGQHRLEKKLTPWIGKRGQVGKIPPVGLGRNNSLS